MPNDELRRRIESLVEDLMRTDVDDAAALASVLLAAQVALRDGYLAKLSAVAWEFVDRRTAPPAPPPPPPPHAPTA
jgi:hypothetical protein